MIQMLISQSCHHTTQHCTVCWCFLVKAASFSGAASVLQASYSSVRERRENCACIMIAIFILKPERKLNGSGAEAVLISLLKYSWARQRCYLKTPSKTLCILCTSFAILSSCRRQNLHQTPIFWLVFASARNVNQAIFILPPLPSSS